MKVLTVACIFAFLADAGVALWQRDLQRALAWLVAAIWAANSLAHEDTPKESQLHRR